MTRSLVCGYACYAGSGGLDGEGLPATPAIRGLGPQHRAAFQPASSPGTAAPAHTERQPDVNVRKLSQASPFCRSPGSCLPK